MNTILVATDGSAGARVAVEQGLELACATGASVTFVAVRNAPAPILGDPYWQRMLSDELARLRPALEEAAEEAEARGVDAEYELMEGDAAHEIVRLARLREVDLIVIGSRGLGTIASAFVGSVSKQVVQAADRPVLVAKERVAALVAT